MQAGARAAEQHVTPPRTERDTASHETPIDAASSSRPNGKVEKPGQRTQTDLVVVVMVVVVLVVVRVQQLLVVRRRRTEHIRALVVVIARGLPHKPTDDIRESKPGGL